MLLQKKWTQITIVYAMDLVLQYCFMGFILAIIVVSILTTIINVDCFHVGHSIFLIT